MNWKTTSGRWNDTGFEDYLWQTSGLPFLEELRDFACDERAPVTPDEAVDLAYRRGQRVVMAALMLVYWVEGGPKDEHERRLAAFHEFYGDIGEDEYGAISAYVRDQRYGEYNGFDLFLQGAPVSPHHTDGKWNDDD